MKNFLVFYKYHSRVHVSRVTLSGELTSEECIKNISCWYDDIICIQPYDVFMLSL